MNTEVVENTEKLRIVLIDDDPDIHTLFEIMLKDYDLDTVSFLGTEEFIQYISKDPKNKIDLLLVDILMNGKSGLYLINKLQDVEHNIKNTAIISSKNDIKTIQYALDHGVRDYIIKPLDKSILLEKISHIIPIKHTSKFNRLSMNFKLSIENFPLEDYIVKAIFLDEGGFICESKLKFKEGSIIEVSHPLFNKLFSRNSFHVAISPLKKENNGTYNFKLNFIGFEEKDYESIRRVIINNRKLEEDFLKTAI